MQWFPRLELSWQNGWVFLVIFYGVYGLLLWAFPHDVVARLYDRSGWSQRQSRLSAMRLFFILPTLAMMVLSPLKVGANVFLVGTATFALGLLGFGVALLNFRDTPPGRPATSGLYRVSRNPQVITLFLASYGICIAIGSWLAVLTLFLAQLCAHFRILAEEGSCLRQYGDSYRAYVQSVPRYFWLF